MRTWLGGISINDVTLSVDIPEGKHRLDLFFGGTVKASAQAAESAKKNRVRVALDSVVRLYARHKLAPLVELAADVLEINQVKGFFRHAVLVDHGPDEVRERIVGLVMGNHEGIQVG